MLQRKGDIVIAVQQTLTPERIDLEGDLDEQLLVGVLGPVVGGLEVLLAQLRGVGAVQLDLGLLVAFALEVEHALVAQLDERITKRANRLRQRLRQQPQLWQSKIGF